MVVDVRVPAPLEDGLAILCKCTDLVRVEDLFLDDLGGVDEPREAVGVDEMGEGVGVNGLGDKFDVWAGEGFVAV